MVSSNSRGGVGMRGRGCGGVWGWVRESGKEVKMSEAKNNFQQDGDHPHNI